MGYLLFVCIIDKSLVKKCSNYHKDHKDLDKIEKDFNEKIIEAYNILQELS